MPKAFPKEFRADVIRVYRDSDSSIGQVARDFGVSPSCLKRWLDIDERDATDQSSRGSAGESDELRGAPKRIPLIEQENEVLRRAAAYLSQAQLQGRTGDFNRFGFASPQICEQAGGIGSAVVLLELAKVGHESLDVLTRSKAIEREVVPLRIRHCRGVALLGPWIGRPCPPENRFLAAPEQQTGPALSVAVPQLLPGRRAPHSPSR
jgi:transposase-like protein